MKRILSWNDFNSCIDQISDSCRDKVFCGVYGVPRGGLCLAVALSHSLNIPYLSDLKADCLVVDDVYETGKTLKRVRDFSNITVFVWFSKLEPNWWKAVELCDSDEWLVFPWESVERADKEEELYRLSRS